MSGRDEEVREVVSELDALLEHLRDNVEALNAILVPPAPDDSSEEVPA